MDIREKLIGRLSMNDIYEMCYLIQSEENDDMNERLYQLTLDADNRVSSNALWIFTHFDLCNNEWICVKHDDLINRVMAEDNNTRKRLMLNLLSRQPFDKERLRADFIDFCIGKITACAQPYAIRALCMKLAYEQCRHYPELLAELETALDMLSQEQLSPGMASTKRNITKKIKKVSIRNSIKG